MGEKITIRWHHPGRRNEDPPCRRWNRWSWDSYTASTPRPCGCSPASGAPARGRGAERLRAPGTTGAAAGANLPWLYRVVRNEALAAQSHGDAATAAANSGPAAPRRGSPAPTTGWTPTRPPALLAELPLELREVIVARLWGGLTFEEVAVAGRLFAADGPPPLSHGTGSTTREARRPMDTHPDDLSDLERRLAACAPSSAGLDADAMLFAAGRASARRGPSGIPLAGLTACLAALAIVLGVGLRSRARRAAGPGRAAPSSRRPRRHRRPPTSEPSSDRRADSVPASCPLAGASWNRDSTPGRPPAAQSRRVDRSRPVIRADPPILRVGRARQPARPVTSVLPSATAF